MPPRPVYSVAKAALIADQIRRFATQHVHQLAAHHANLDFWIAEAASAVQTIDDYHRRFKRLRNAQVKWVREHDTKISWYCPICRGGCEFGPQTPARPRRVSSDDLAEARDDLRRAVRQYLVRLYHAELINEAEIREHAERVGASIETEDLESEEPHEDEAR
ncbi:MAG: hypothetical protein R3B72_44330 [Polyangiaceae bacterium]